MPGFLQRVVCALLTAAVSTTEIALTRKRLLVNFQEATVGDRLPSAPHHPLRTNRSPSLNLATSTGIALSIFTGPSANQRIARAEPGRLFEFAPSSREWVPFPLPPTALSGLRSTPMMLEKGLLRAGRGPRFKGHDEVVRAPVREEAREPRQPCQHETLRRQSGPGTPQHALGRLGRLP